MATFTDSGFPTLPNILKTLRPDGSVETQFVDILSKKLPLLEDMPWKAANKKTSHLITSVSGLPSPTWRRLNEGVARTKGTTVQYEEACGLLEDRSDVDEKAVELYGQAYRTVQDKMKMEGFSQLLETAIFYENAASAPERLHGFSARYPATSGYTASAYTLKPGTNSGVNCRSVWLINWNEDRCYGIYPENSVGGIRVKDKGQRYTTSAVNALEMSVLTTQYNLDCGLAVEDYRYNCRMQWDPDDATNFATSAKGMYLSMLSMISAVYDMDETKARFYMDRVSLNLLNQQLASNDANYLTYIELGKRRVQAFCGIPIRVTDSLVQESAIS